MASTIHKSVQERSNRRRRYIAVVDHFRKRYNCTAAEVYGIATGIEKDNVNLKKQVSDLADENGRLNQRIVALREKLMEAGINPD